jgi:hypothetical protein
VEPEPHNALDAVKNGFALMVLFIIAFALFASWMKPEPERRIVSGFVSTPAGKGARE